MEIILFTIFLLLFLYYIAFLIMILYGIKNTKLTVQNGIPLEFVSVIIPFRNESENILRSLDSIKSQDYPIQKFEVIYINDFSEDDSLQKLMFAEKPENVRIISLKAGNSELLKKSDVLYYGVDQAKGNIIVTTDCDCYHGPHWLRSLLSYYDKNTAFISGPVSFCNNSTTFQELQTIEFAGLILAGAGLVGIKKPIICNAANVTFRKNIYFELIKYSDNQNLSSTDAEFLMRVIDLKTDYNIKFSFNKEAVTYTYPSKDIHQFLQQRKRWVNNSLTYERSFPLYMIFLFLLSVPLQILLAIVLNVWYLILFLIVFVGKIIIEYLVLKKGAGLLIDSVKMKFFILAELLHIPYILISVISGIFGNVEWKNRKFKN